MIVPKVHPALSTILAAVALLLIMLAIGKRAAPERSASNLSRTNPVPTVFVDVTAAAGITNVHHEPVLDHQLDNIMAWVSSVGAAAAAADFNGDGWMDL